MNHWTSLQEPTLGRIFQPLLDVMGRCLEDLINKMLGQGNMAIVERWLLVKVPPHVQPGQKVRAAGNFAAYSKLFAINFILEFTNHD